MPSPASERLLANQAKKLGVTIDELQVMLIRSWKFRARPKQIAPSGEWVFWYILAGRGFGKTISGAQWAREKGLRRRGRVALIAPTLGDVRDTMIEGETGLLSVLRTDELLGGSRVSGYNRSQLSVTLANGTKMQGFSSEEPDRLRGPQHHYVWGEEISSWKDAKHGNVLNSTFSNMTLGLRLGAHPQACLTSTPKADKLTRELIQMAKTGRLALVHGSSYENRANLSDVWWETIIAPLEGTRTGRQEILAEVLEDVEGALWTRSVIEQIRVPRTDLGEIIPRLSKIVVAVDPNTTSGEAADNAGVIVVARGTDGLGYVLDDKSQTRGGPRAWAQAAVDAYDEWSADMIVAETNQGGEMVKLTIAAVDPSAPVKMVSASRGKRTRAEPVATLYEGDRPLIRHVGPFPDLEDEMVTWTPESDSPGRMDALVWGMTELELWKSYANRGSFLPEQAAAALGLQSDAVDLDDPDRVVDSPHV